MTDPVLALRETQRAFDGVATGYDRSNEANRTLRDMRERTWHALQTFIPPASHVLDLGCGPGCDDEHLARRGHRVTAIDWSPAMVEEARRRIRDRRLAGRVEVRHLGIQELDRLAPALFDAACSNFGPLNCVPDLESAARLIAARLRPGGVLVASVIGRVCPWEIAVHLARGDWTRVRVRFTRQLAPVPLDGRTVWTRYYTAGEFERIFAAAGFRRVSLRTLGLFVPPPYLQAFADRHRPLVTRLQRLDDRVGGWPGIRACGDHFLIVLRKGDPVERLRTGDSGRTLDANAEDKGPVGRSSSSSTLPAPAPSFAESAVRRPVRTTWMPRFACPECGSDFQHHVGSAIGESLSFFCVRCGLQFAQREGLWRFLTPVRLAAAQPFIAQYRVVRDREGRRQSSPEYYRMLPSVAADDPHAREWHLRRETYHHLLGQAFATAPQSIRVLDVGAGSGWLSHRLSELGHRVVAVDVLDDDADGLGARRHYRAPFVAVQADFDALPFAPQQFDVVVFNGSLHYARDVAATLARAHRMLASGGALVVMDSPMFHRDCDGRAMAAELRRRFQSDYGLEPVVHPGVAFLTFRELSAIADALDRRPHFVPSRGPLGWRVHRHLARVRLRRPAAAFGLWIAR
jgi:SAM-dependent methyltransferase